MTGKNPGIRSCLVMFVYVICYLKMVFPHHALDLQHHGTALGLPLQMHPFVFTWLLSWVVTLCRHSAPLSLFDAILLSDHTEMGWYRWERQGWLTDKTWRQYPNLSDPNVFLGDTSL